MKKNYGFIIGLDVSKAKLDYCIMNQATMHQEFGCVANTARGIETFLTSLKKKLKVEKEDILFCLENTGVYSMPACVSTP